MFKNYCTRFPGWSIYMRGRGANYFGETWSISLISFFLSEISFKNTDDNGLVFLDNRLNSDKGMKK